MLTLPEGMAKFDELGLLFGTRRGVVARRFGDGGARDVERARLVRRVERKAVENS